MLPCETVSAGRSLIGKNTAFKGLAKVRHIDVNCLCLQEQCAKKMVPLVKIPGEDNTAYLMTKHLSNPVMMKHVTALNLEMREGRGETAARLHSVENRAPGPDEKEESHPRRSPVGDFWSEKGEHGRWVRTHVTPRVAMFYPEEAPGGPGRKTRLKFIEKDARHVC